MMFQLSRSTTHGRVVLAIALAAAAGAARAQTGDAAAIALVERGGRYVQDYERAFSAIVCEERQVQTLVRADGTVRKRRELKSDFLLVKIGADSLQGFRDVIEVDGKPVRDRQDRLRKLFLETPKTALEQARAIGRESGRHNIGVSRSLTSPLLMLRILLPRVASGFHFTVDGRTLTFQEFRSPSIIRHRSGGEDHDLPSHGSFEIDPESGRVLAAELTAVGSPPWFSTTSSVRYQEDPALQLMVPVENHERYWQAHKPRDDRLEVSSSYSNFRRFQVTVDEQIKVPK